LVPQKKDRRGRFPYPGAWEMVLQMKCPTEYTVLGTVDDSIVKVEFPKDPLSSSVKGILGN
jgi:hypothetical protein